jgi:tungstate transport system substrate-binding protein
MHRAGLSLLVALVKGAAAAFAQEQSIDVASTTSTQDSGLILPVFKAKTGIDVKVVAQGTGQALDTARRWDADVVFVHARAEGKIFSPKDSG